MLAVALKAPAEARRLLDLPAALTPAEKAPLPDALGRVLSADVIHLP
jgi:hypothetical protein